MSFSTFVNSSLSSGWQLWPAGVRAQPIALEKLMPQEEKEDVVEENMEDIENMEDVEDMEDTFLSFPAICSCATTDILISFSAMLPDMGRE